MKNVTVFCLLMMMSPFINASECVVLLHGLARTDASMRKMELSLQEDGYQVVNHRYPSRKYSIEDLADSEIPKALLKCDTDVKINFVTHSLGGIVLRQYLSTKTIENLGRVVMLGPPNQGSEVIDNVKDMPGFKLINGQAGFQLGTDENSIPSKLGPVAFELGVIAGTKTINPILSQMLPNPDDGKVSVERTKVDGMADHMVVPVSHPFLMRNDKVILQVKYFLKNGMFDHNG